MQFYYLKDKRNKTLIFVCSSYPASQERLLHNLVTFYWAYCRGIRKKGWTLVSADIRMTFWVLYILRCVLMFVKKYSPGLLCPSHLPLKTNFSAIRSWSHHPPSKNVSTKVSLLSSNTYCSTLSHHPAWKHNQTTNHVLLHLSVSSAGPQRLQHSNGLFLWQLTMHPLQLSSREFDVTLYCKSSFSRDYNYCACLLHG